MYQKRLNCHFSKAFLMASKLPSVSPKMDEEKKFLAFKWMILMVSKLPSVSPKMDEEKKFLALVDDAYLPNI